MFAISFIPPTFFFLPLTTHPFISNFTSKFIILHPMFFFLLSITSWRHSMPIAPSETITLLEFNKLKDSNLTISLETLPSNNFDPTHLFYSITTPKTRSEQFLKDTKTELKFNDIGTYQILITNNGTVECYFSISTFTDAYVPDEDQLHIKKITSKLRNDLEAIFSENMGLKELKEINLRALRKDRKWMLTLVVLPIMYIVVGFMCLRIQKGFFTPNNK